MHDLHYFINILYYFIESKVDNEGEHITEKLTVIRQVARKENKSSSQLRWPLNFI